MRAVGDEWEASASRLAELGRTRYGTLAEAAGGRETPEESASEPEPTKGRKRAAGAARAPQKPTYEELEGMTVRQLVELCILEGVETEGRPRKAELLSALKAHYGLE